MTKFSEWLTRLTTTPYIEIIDHRAHAVMRLSIRTTMDLLIGTSAWGEQISTDDNFRVVGIFDRRTGTLYRQPQNYNIIEPMVEAMKWDKNSPRVEYLVDAERAAYKAVNTELNARIQKKSDLKSNWAKARESFDEGFCKEVARRYFLSGILHPDNFCQAPDADPKDGLGLYAFEGHRRQKDYQVLDYLSDPDAFVKAYVDRLLDDPNERESLMRQILRSKVVRKEYERLMSDPEDVVHIQKAVFQTIAQEPCAQSFKIVFERDSKEYTGTVSAQTLRYFSMTNTNGELWADDIRWDQGRLRGVIAGKEIIRISYRKKTLYERKVAGN